MLIVVTCLYLIWFSLSLSLSLYSGSSEGFVVLDALNSSLNYLKHVGDGWIKVINESLHTYYENRIFNCTNSCVDDKLNEIASLVLLL